MERKSGVLPGTPYGLQNDYGRLVIDRTDSVVYGSRRVSHCRSEMSGVFKGLKETGMQDKINSRDPECWIKRDILSLLDDEGERLTPESVSYSTGMGSRKIEKPDFQPVNGSFTHFWNQRKVSNAGFQKSWPPGAEVFPDPVQLQDFASPYLLVPDSSEPVPSINHNEGGHASVNVVSLGAGESSYQQLPATGKKQLIRHWELLEGHAKTLEEGSPAWNTAWQEAYNFASHCSESDYHFKLNVAIALTRLNNTHQAKIVLLDQLGTCNDQRYLLGVSKQLGFLFFKEGNYISAIKYYMRGFSAILHVPNETYLHIYRSVKRIIRDCPDRQFVTDAVSWFNCLIPKTRENKLEITSLMFPFAYSWSSFSKISETALKYLESDPFKGVVAQWKEMEAMAMAQKPDTPQWHEAWACARDFALECAKVDYHFYLNAAIALTRLNLLDQAIYILLQQLSNPELVNDQAFLLGVNKQLGFIYFRKGKYADSIRYYMRCFDGSRAVADKTYGYICVSMEFVKRSVNPEFTRSAFDWFRQLFSQSMEDNWLSGNKQPVTTAPVLPLK